MDAMTNQAARVRKCIVCGQREDPANSGTCSQCGHSQWIGLFRCYEGDDRREGDDREHAIVFEAIDARSAAERYPAELIASLREGLTELRVPTPVSMRVIVMPVDDDALVSRRRSPWARDDHGEPFLVFAIRPSQVQWDAQEVYSVMAERNARATPPPSEPDDRPFKERVKAAINEGLSTYSAAHA